MAFKIPQRYFHFSKRVNGRKQVFPPHFGQDLSRNGGIQQPDSAGRMILFVQPHFGQCGIKSSVVGITIIALLILFVFLNIRIKRFAPCCFIWVIHHNGYDDRDKHKQNLTSFFQLCPISDTVVCCAPMNNLVSENI